METFKDIKGYDDYQVSNLGRVKSLLHGKERILKPCMTRKGYLLVNLYKDGEGKSYFVHRLVAEAFIPNPDNLPQINHKDECKINNCIENLEWCSASYNMNYNDGQKRRGVKKINGKRSKKVYQYSLDGVLVAEYPSTNEVHRQLGYSQSNIRTCCNGKLKTAYGYKWSYNLY